MNLLTKTAISSGTALSLIALSWANPAAAFQIFTDRTSWETALANQGLFVDFTETFDNDISNANTITFDSGIESAGSPAGQGFINNEVVGGQFDGRVDTDQDNSNMNRFATINWTFPMSIAAWGADFASAATGEILEIVGNFDRTGDQVINFGPAGINVSDGFVGIIGLANFDNITFRSDVNNTSGTTDERFQVDNFSVAKSAATVPEPSAVLGLGLLGLGAFCKRKLSQKQKQDSDKA